MVAAAAARSRRCNVHDLKSNPDPACCGSASGRESDDAKGTGGEMADFHGALQCGCSRTPNRLRLTLREAGRSVLSFHNYDVQAVQSGNYLIRVRRQVPTYIVRSPQTNGGILPTVIALLTSALQHYFAHQASNDNSLPM